ncbi:MAG: hypothetical protein LCH37_11630 [Bacteroidetes bacterium]|nr:hypothetical protein [Bacteroidota bacterium]
MKAILKYLFLLNTTSIDIAIGVVLWSLVLQVTYNLSFQGVYLFLSFTGTLTVYWLDHLLDWKLHPNPQDTRAAFFGKHFQVMGLLSIVLIGISIPLAFIFLSFHEWIYGIVLSAFMSVYLFFHRVLHRVSWLKKEFLISILYVSSIFFPIVVSNGFGSVLPDFLAFVVVVFYAVLAVGFRELNQDNKLGITNFFQSSQSKAFKSLPFFGLLGLSAFLPVNGLPVAFLLAFLPILIAHYFIAKGYFRHMKYRLVSEWSFVLAAGIAFLFAKILPKGISLLSILVNNMGRI